MANFANSIDRVAKRGFQEMKTKWNNLGKPRAKVSSNSGTIAKADARGKNDACLKG